MKRDWFGRIFCRLGLHKWEPDRDGCCRTCLRCLVWQSLLTHKTCFKYETPEEVDAELDRLLKYRGWDD